MASTAAKEHVAEIRRKKFSIGGQPNPLVEDLHQAVKNLSAELYAKDVHFLMELIQNAEDNEYPEGVTPSLEFVITSKDITNTGAPATLLVFNNEMGFSSQNIESICSVGRSTKKGLRKRGYIGEKGIGFKSVFLITAQPYIFSNGYRIRFNEKPCQHCNVGYIVPEWVEEEDPTLSAIKVIYGSGSDSGSSSDTALPTTTLVLPLKAEMVKPVKDQLSSVHPEILLFLSKIKRFSVRETNEDPSRNTMNAISISSEKNFVTSKSMDADSYTLYLTADDDTDSKVVDSECGYYMWKQRFPVKQENRVDVRKEVEEWVITLAFPFGERQKRGKNMPGIFSFLPTETVTNFPFIIQADFLLASSRESILWENKWNQGILDCVSIAFFNAFILLVKSTVDAPISSLPNMFRYLPVNESSHPNLNKVRSEIKGKLINETIIPCESYTSQKFFCKPNEVGRLNPAFWSILYKARSEGVSLYNISSHGSYIVSSSFDKSEYKVILDFLEINLVDYDWYAKCIGGSNLVMDVSENVYLDLLVFIAERWHLFQNTSVKNIPMIKYVLPNGNVDLFKISEGGTNWLIVAEDSNHMSWLIDWNTEFYSSTRSFFLPKVTQEAIESSSKKHILRDWLMTEVKVMFFGVNGFAEYLLPLIANDRKLVVTYTHFLLNSLRKKYLLEHEVKNICSKMPIVDNYGQLIVKPDAILVPANGSKWVELIGSNPWRQLDLFELGEQYTRRVSYFGIDTPREDILSFLKTYFDASDVLNLCPPNAAIPTFSSALTKTNTFLLLKWLQNLKKAAEVLPERFLSSIKHGNWLKISLSGSPGYRSPSESFMLDSSSGHLLQNGSVLVDIPLVDVSFYGDEIEKYKDELQTIGVRFEIKDACEFIGNRLMSLAATSNLTRDNVIQILKFIQYLGVNYISSKDFIVSIKGGKFLKTLCGYMTPSNSVLFSDEWNVASQISNIPFIDQDYYGTELLSFKNELELLGVVVNFDQSNCYQIVSDNLKSPSSFPYMSSDAFYLVLKCITFSNSSGKIVEELKNSRCLNTNLGYRLPFECFLISPESQWDCLVQVFGSVPVVDENFYGSCIFSMSNQLKEIGVKVDLEDASKEFTRTFKQNASLFLITKEILFSFLLCYRGLKYSKVEFPSEINECIRNEKWIRTRLGDYRSPNECILYSNEWEPITPVSILPFIDDSDNFYGSGIHDYREELKQLGVVADFKDGATFVASGLSLPQDSSSITSANVYAFLDCVKILKEKHTVIPKKFLEKLSQNNWLKTKFGYKRPNECLLFYSDWGPFLEHNDGPFIDEDFYGSGIESYTLELNSLGVITDINKGCELVHSVLKFHSNFETISRIYNYFSEFKYSPVDEDKKNIWIPKGANNGEWVTPQECAIHDKNNLFSDQLNILETFKYEKNILNFFSEFFKVKLRPSVDDYCNLWKKWEGLGCQITNAECCAFWEFVVKSWNSKTEETFIRNLSKLSVLDPDPKSDGIFLSEKRDVFIGDDLFLMDLFQRCSRPVFVWYPRPTLISLSRTKLLEIYNKLGVRNLSESAQKYISDVEDVENVEFKPVNSEALIMKSGLLKLILGFLADPKLKFDSKTRHEAVSRVLAIEAFETPEPMAIKYSLSLSSGDVINVESRRTIRWDKQNSKLFMQKIEKPCGHKYEIEFASHFAEVIANGVLWENEELIPHLFELIRLGFLMEFDDEAVDFLMKTKNLQIFLEDQDFLSSRLCFDKSQPADDLGRVYKRQKC